MLVYDDFCVHIWSIIWTLSCSYMISRIWCWYMIKLDDHIRTVYDHIRTYLECSYMNICSYMMIICEHVRIWAHIWSYFPFRWWWCEECYITLSPRAPLTNRGVGITASLSALPQGGFHAMHGLSMVCKVYLLVLELVVLARARLSLYTQCV